MEYRGKVEARERARELRAEGWTMPDIAAELGVSNRSVSLWTRDIEVDVGPRRVATPRPNRLRGRRLAEVDEMNSWAADRLGSLGEQAFLAAGAALYAGEGSKGDGMVSLANSDPSIVPFFLAWLRRFFDIDEARLRVRLYLHEGLDLEAANRHWAEVTANGIEQFGRPYRPYRTSASEPTSTSSAAHRPLQLCSDAPSGHGPDSSAAMFLGVFRGSSIGGAGHC